MESRETFLAERRLGIGGSDLGDLLNLPPYGCQRRLWYDKAGFAADFPEDSDWTETMDWCRDLEENIKTKFEDRTSAVVKLTDTCAILPGFPAIRCHPDGWVYYDDRPDGIISIKAVGPGVARQIRREGPSAEYEAQMQYELGITGLSWGVFAMMDRASGHFVFIEERTPIPELIEGLFERVRDFWTRYIIDSDHDFPEPDRLAIGDQRCKKCRWRKTCRGDEYAESIDSPSVVEDPYLDLLAERYDDARAREKAAADEKDAARDEILQIVGGSVKLSTEAFQITVREGRSTSIDLKTFAKDFPIDFALMKRESTYPIVTIKALKGVKNGF